MFGAITPVHIAILVAFAAVMVVFVVINMKKNWGNTPDLEICRGLVMHKRFHDPKGDGPRRSSSTMYYATFRLPDGQERELGMWDDNYSKLAEGQFGKLIYRGKRLISFEAEEGEGA